MDLRCKITGVYAVKTPQHEAVVTDAGRALGEQVLADVHRLMVLTNQIRDGNDATVIEVESVD